jgi:nitroreductase
MVRRITRRQLLRTAPLVLAARGRTASAAEPGCTLDALLARRRMVRRFTSEPVPAATIRRLLAAAVRAPSAGHTQPWAFVVVRTPEARARLADAALGQAFVAAAPVVIVVCADVSRARPRYRERAERYGVIDAAFASLILLFAVAETGLGACFVGAFDDARVARIVGLPDDVRPIAVVPVGHPAEAPKRMRLRRVDEVLHRERW